jgi:hypothetical protein
MALYIHTTEIQLKIDHCFFRKPLNKWQCSIFNDVLIPENGIVAQINLRTNRLKLHADLRHNRYWRS